VVEDEEEEEWEEEEEEEEEWEEEWEEEEEEEEEGGGGGGSTTISTATREAQPEEAFVHRALQAPEVSRALPVTDLWCWRAVLLLRCHRVSCL
jgi:hypothetical protein